MFIEFGVGYGPYLCFQPKSPTLFTDKSSETFQSTTETVGIHPIKAKSETQWNYQLFYSTKSNQKTIILFHAPGVRAYVYVCAKRPQVTEQAHRRSNTLQ